MRRACIGDRLIPVWFPQRFLNQKLALQIFRHYLHFPMVHFPLSPASSGRMQVEGTELGAQVTFPLNDQVDIGLGRCGYWMEEGRGRCGIRGLGLQRRQIHAVQEQGMEVWVEPKVGGAVPGSHYFM